MRQRACLPPVHPPGPPPPRGLHCSGLVVCVQSQMCQAGVFGQPENDFEGFLLVLPTWISLPCPKARGGHQFCQPAALGHGGLALMPRPDPSCPSVTLDPVKAIAPPFLTGPGQGRCRVRAGSTAEGWPGACRPAGPGTAPCPPRPVLHGPRPHQRAQCSGRLLLGTWGRAVLGGHVQHAGPRGPSRVPCVLRRLGEQGQVRA